MSRPRGLAVFAFALGVAILVGAADPKPAATPTVDVIVTDAAGNDVTVNGTLSAGVRKLAWLPNAPLAIDFRDENSTTFAVGVSTFVPVSTVESIRYEEATQGKATIKTVKLKLAGVEKPLSGPGQFKGINQIGVDGMANGKPVKYLAGSPKTNLTALKFPAAKPTTHTPAAGPVWSVKIDQPRVTTPTQDLSNPKVLLGSKDGETLSDTLPVRKGEPIPLAKIKKLEIVAVNGKANLVVVEVTLDDGAERTVIVPQSTGPADKLTTFLGIVGEVPVGWKLIPLHAMTVAERK